MKMPPGARLARAPFFPLLRIPRYPVFTREEEGGNSSKTVRGFALLLLLCLILYAPGLASIPPVDRDEARFAQATRQMLETGDFIRIRFQDEARNRKPIGIHWLQAAAVAPLSTPGGTAIWPYRLPSALAATVAVLPTAALGATLLSSRRAGFVAGVVMASALVVEAHLAKTDAALLATIVAGQLALGIVYVRARAAPQRRSSPVICGARVNPYCRSAITSRASSSCSARQPAWRRRPRQTNSSQAPGWRWSAIGKTRRSENPWRRVG